MHLLARRAFSGLLAAVLESASSSVCELCEPNLLSPVCNPPGAGCLVELLVHGQLDHRGGGGGGGGGRGGWGRALPPPPALGKLRDLW